MADLIGQQLGNYRLIRLLGHGGFGEVYLGQHLRLNKQAAIKVQRLRLADEDIEVEQVVLTALAKDPKQRFRTVQAFATALEQAYQPAPSRPIVVPSQETLPREPWRPSEEKRMASELSQA